MTAAKERLQKETEVIMCQNFKAIASIATTFILTEVRRTQCRAVSLQPLDASVRARVFVYAADMIFLGQTQTALHSSVGHAS